MKLLSTSRRFGAPALLILLLQVSSGFVNPILAEGAKPLSSGGVVGVAAPQAASPLYLPLVSKNYSPYSALRMVNIPYFATPGNPDNTLDDSQWTQSAIFWLGINEILRDGQGAIVPPGRNYADVRVAYSSYGIHVRVTVIDYYLWYVEEDQAPASQDLTQWDSVAVFFDTSFDRADRPQSDDYYFLTAPRIWDNNPSNPYQYRRDARGTGTAWDMTWSGTWKDAYGMVYSANPGPNNNNTSLDYGGDVLFTIPWTTLGRSGPPAEGTVWGLGVIMYDRDTALTSGITTPQTWPEALDINDPGTWGRLHFGLARYTPPPGTPEGTTTIRAASPTDNTVEDAWVGGGGNCVGGHEGQGEVNHGDDTSLFVAAQALSADFPCFSKSYLRFSLNAIPAGKVILSATITLRHWGNANPSLAKPSWVHLFTITDPWQEMSIHWNNAPLAKENVSATWIYPLSAPPPGLIGTAYDWDATQAVAEAYAQGQPLSVAIYSSDTDFHSSKYLGSSESLDQYQLNRPLLTVVWGK